MMGQVGRSQALLALAHVCRLLLFVALTALLGRRLAPADFAFVALVSSLYILAVEVLDMGTSAVAARQIAAQATVERATLSALLALRRWLAVLLTTAVVGLALSPLMVQDSQRLALLAVAGGIFMMHWHAYQTVFQLRQAYGRLVVLGLSCQLGFLLASAAVLKLQAGGAVIALLIVLREGVLVLGSRWAAVRLLGGRLQAPWRCKGMRSLLQQGWMIGVAGVSYKLAVYGGVFLLYRPDAPEALASFSAAHRVLIPLVDMAWLLVNPLFASLGIAAAHSAQGFRIQFEGHVKWMFGLAFMAAVAAMFTAPSVIRLLYGEAYLSDPVSAIGPFRWLALGGLFAWVTPVFVVAETTRGNARALMALGLACLGLTIVGNEWAIPRHGANGAAAVLCLCEALVLAVLVVRFAARRDLRLNAAWVAYLVPGLLLGAAMLLADGSPLVQWVLAGVGIPGGLYLLLQLPAQRARRASVSLLSAKWSPTSHPPNSANQHVSP